MNIHEPLAPAWSPPGACEAVGASGEQGEALGGCLDLWGHSQDALGHSPRLQGVQEAAGRAPPGSTGQPQFPDDKQVTDTHMPGPPRARLGRTSCTPALTPGGSSLDCSSLPSLNDGKFLFTRSRDLLLCTKREFL